MQRLITTFILIAALVLSGCATKPYVSDPEHSFAWNVTKAAEVNVKDVSWEKVQKARAEALAKGVPVDNRPTALGATAYGVVHGLNMGSLLSGGLGALAWMSTGTDVDPSMYSKVLVWMPKEMADYPEKASEKIVSMVRSAYEKALAQTPFPKGYTVSTEEQTVHFGEFYKRTGYFISGNECSNQQRPDAWYKQIQAPIVMKAFRLKPVKVLPEAGLSPDFASDGESWTYSLPLSGKTFFDEKSSQFLPKFPDLEVFRHTSANLPSWLSIYLSPVSQISMADGNGGFKFLEYPIILNQGKIHYFIEPPPQVISSSDG